jgi:AraC-like DNA-binding protein
MIINSGRSAAPTGGDKWQEVVSEAYFPLDTECRNRTDFFGEMDRWSLGVVGLSRIHCDSILYRRQRRHFLNETESSLLIAIPENEEVQFLQNQRRTSCKPGGFLVERSDAPYEYWHDGRNVQWVLKVPSASVRARIGPSERLGGLTFDARQGVASYFLSTLRTAVSHIQHLDDAAREAAGSHLLEMLCLAIRNDQRVLDSNTSSIRAAHLYRAEQFIRDNLKEPDLSPRLVADACGISLRYLQQLFLESDQSINGYIRDRRLIRCSEDLRAAGQGATVAEIAYRWGFADQSQFSKHYKAKFGCTPTETRKEAGRFRKEM